MVAVFSCMVVRGNVDKFIFIRRIFFFSIEVDNMTPNQMISLWLKFKMSCSGRNIKGNFRRCYTFTSMLQQINNRLAVNRAAKNQT